MVGDKKTPKSWSHHGVRYVSPEEQTAGMSPCAQFARLCPWNHYARKNVGYLLAMEHGASLILETDDDNTPLATFGMDMSLEVVAKPVLRVGWENIYRHFTRARIWPRGFPLELVADSFNELTALGRADRTIAPVQQYLADGEPDVDAIYRMIVEAGVSFGSEEVLLPPGTWCPFNSQNTAWWPAAYPLMYLPAHVTFRMTDIWRSFVAQRVLHSRGSGVVFRGPTVKQNRNAHSLLGDFQDEIPGYLHNRAIVQTLSELPLSGSWAPEEVCDSLSACYRQLARRGWIPDTELDLLEHWIGAVLALRAGDPDSPRLP